MPTPTAPMPTLGLSASVLMDWVGYVSQFWEQAALIAMTTIVMFIILQFVKGLFHPLSGQVRYMGMSFDRKEIEGAVRGHVKGLAQKRAIERYDEAVNHREVGVDYVGVDDDDDL